jgi:hypothetical protein
MASNILVSLCSWLQESVSMSRVGIYFHIENIVHMPTMLWNVATTLVDELKLDCHSVDLLSLSHDEEYNYTAVFRTPDAKEHTVTFNSLQYKVNK